MSSHTLIDWFRFFFTENSPTCSFISLLAATAYISLRMAHACAAPAKKKKRRKSRDVEEEEEEDDKVCGMRWA